VIYAQGTYGVYDIVAIWKRIGNVVLNYFVLMLCMTIKKSHKSSSPWQAQEAYDYTFVKFIKGVRI
jgi:hypothetical protein